MAKIYGKKDSKGGQLNVTEEQMRIANLKVDDEIDRIASKKGILIKKAD
ncbi:hypothetical protein LCGC14_1212960 [marine sediment metagenome]|uniref:SpoVT-AbrB domain-containing protein n=1 Tax=marine sediment metagenome TaxID=412755 RepID=A0A0F9M0W9_9ZZZZ